MATVTVGAGRFEQSFQFHMIRDFFLLLVAVAVVELAIRYALLRYDFAEREPARVEQAAQQLANDVKSIMLNSGGPMAAQTVYPILNRNYDDLGLSIAVLPSEVTVESMKLTFNMDVKGLSPRWPEGAHQQADSRADGRAVLPGLPRQGQGRRGAGHGAGAQLPRPQGGRCGGRRCASPPAP